MDDQDFQTKATQALEQLNDRLGAAADEHDFEVDFNAGALTIEFDEPRAKFVVSPNSPVHQIWVSAHSKSFKLGWDSSVNAFVLPETGQTLDQLMADAVGKQIGATILL